MQDTTKNESRYKNKTRHINEHKRLCRKNKDVAQQKQLNVLKKNPGAKQKQIFQVHRVQGAKRKHMNQVYRKSKSMKNKT